ncbi:MAG: aromatic amino acid hydroxylase [Bacteriovoracaceae bacterium]|jgi:phenylalanine-4-hydroxylase|nr:aromatic amino acid hydroxylase [Bacteriovoracaceae bacterium]
MGAYQEVVDKLPPHLKIFAVDQNYDQYSPINQACWRYIMRGHLHHFKKHGPKVYTDGIHKSGITVDEIPTIDGINEHLAKMGWSAVVVNGFIPPNAFMEFQQHKIFPVSAEMRTMEHILYTPAPDIVHEAAGHVPIILESEYSEFLSKVGEYGSKSIFTKKDQEVYKAIRNLSIVKEWPNATEEDVVNAEKNLTLTLEKNETPSEATLISRFHWWTVEYGLVGEVENPEIFGAGLLSSMGESRTCLDSDVKKIPLSIDCFNYSYDITSKQPQLFVAKDWEHLLNVLEEFASTMAFRVGGVVSLEKAIASENQATIQYSSGLQVSGLLTKAHCAGELETYIQMTGPTSLCFHDKELKNHGPEQHGEGFGSPVGKLVDVKRPLENHTNDELKEIGITIGESCELNFLSGVKVSGVLKELKRKENKKIILMTFENCTVTGSKGEELFNPSWGVYDMAVGERIVSVFSGPADKVKYPDGTYKSDDNAIEIKYTEEEKTLFKKYSKVRTIRENVKKGAKLDMNELHLIYMNLKKKYPSDWLLRIEIYELLVSDEENAEHSMVGSITEELEKLKEVSVEQKFLIEEGIKLIQLAL